MSESEHEVDEFDRVAAGMDLDDTAEAHGRSLGDALVSGGPEALLDEIEELLPEKWREHIRHFPLTAISIALGVGVFLGLKKGDELVAAGTAMVSAAATANLNEVLSNHLDT